MAILYGYVILKHEKGFVLNLEDQHITEGKHIIFISKDFNILRVQEDKLPYEFQVEKLIARLGCEFKMNPQDDLLEPTVCLTIDPISQQTIIIQPVTPGGIKIGAPQIHKISEYAPKKQLYITHSQTITLMLEGFDAVFTTDFSKITRTPPVVREPKDKVVVPSSEASPPGRKPRSDSGTPRPSILLKTVSFIKETPTTSRYMDIDDQVDEETENSQGKISLLMDDSSPPPKQTFNEDADLLKNDSSSISMQVVNEEDDAKDLDNTTAPGGWDEALPQAKNKKAAKYSKERTMMPDRGTKRQAKEDIEKKASKKTRPQSPELPPPPKKRRGQPKQSEVKSDPPVEDDEMEISISQRSVDIPKPTRGKGSEVTEIPLVMQHEEDEISDVNPAKKKRGRPKKSKTPASEAGIPSSEPEGSHPKRSQRTVSVKLTVVFSNSTFMDKAQPQSRKFVHSHMKVTEDVDESIDLLCIGSTNFTKTPKLLKAILLGKSIVTDEWIQASIGANAILPWSEYIATYAQAEIQWSIAKGWAEGNLKANGKDWAQHTLYITPLLRQQYGSAGFKAVNELGDLLGFKLVTSYPATSDKSSKLKNFLALGIQAGDKDTRELQANGFNVYHKDLLHALVLRGSSDLPEEFLLEPVPVTKRVGKKTKA